MKKVFFFCDSQMNILTTYFISKIYYSADEYELFLMVSNNSDNSVACAKRAGKLDLWKEVRIIEEAGQNREELERIGETVSFSQEDIVHLYALQNRFARLLYKKAYDGKVQINITDEGVFLFNDFLKWQEEAPNEMLSDIKVKNTGVKAWCYCPEMYQLPDDVTVKRIQLREALEDDAMRITMQEEVRILFGIKEEEMPEVIYFDNYYTLFGRTTAEVEKYLLKKLSVLCEPLDFAIKKHPMERGFQNKYEGIAARVLETSASPWEAIYFVNIYKKTEKKFVCITGESTSVFNLALMYGDRNYSIILLKDIYDCYLKPVEWDSEKFFARFSASSIGDYCRVYRPKGYDELQTILSELTGQPLDGMDQLKAMDQDMLCRLCFKNVGKEKCQLVCGLQVYRDGTHVEDVYKEHIIDGTKFYLSYDISPKYIDETLSFKWCACANGFIAFKSVKCTIISDTKKEIYDMSWLLSGQNVIEKEDGWCEIQDMEPVFDLPLHITKITQVVIEGEWKFDFSHDRVGGFLKEKFSNELQVERNALAESKREIDKLIEKSREISARKDEAALAYETTISQLKEEILEKDNCLKTAASEKEDLEKRLSNITNTFSWKITRPLRFVRKKLR